MKIYNTQDPQAKPPIIMLLYGQGGVGKTTFVSTSENPILADCENGAKYFGLRGIEMDVAQIQKWQDMKEFLSVAQSDIYDVVAIDPIGELMEKLKRFMVEDMKDGKLTQRDGTPTMAGWGFLKDTMRMYLKALRDAGKHVILIAHVDEKGDEDRLVKRPMIATKISDEIINMVDVVGFMTTLKDNESGETKRAVMVDPDSDKYIAKDRTGQLGTVIPPNFKDIVRACQGTKKFKWSNPDALEAKDKEETLDPEPKVKEVKNEASKEDTATDKKPETSKKEEKPAKEEKTDLEKAEEKKPKAKALKKEKKEDNAEVDVMFDIKNKLFEETKSLIEKVPEDKREQALANIVASGQFDDEQVEQLQDLLKPSEE